MEEILPLNKFLIKQYNTDVGGFLFSCLSPCRAPEHDSFPAGRLAGIRSSAIRISDQNHQCSDRVLQPDTHSSVRHNGFCVQLLESNYTFLSIKSKSHTIIDEWLHQSVRMWNAGGGLLRIKRACLHWVLKRTGSRDTLPTLLPGCVRGLFEVQILLPTS